ncbi:GGDEF domain-containing protein [Egibacter rhizosphaerae]|uniref:GGDEF domain-containing protein n=1 Tax=Egibacter rhizosphaerae TaxID=1670831 RepID=A0A411YG74_9ACTN|nr:GGDEF domain-containing protein [Egibacter rhizosphaerae]
MASPPGQAVAHMTVGVAAVSVLDVDDFKAFNEVHHHGAGDVLLAELAARWRELVPEQATLARYGGDEFVIVLPGHSSAEALAVVETLRGRVPEGQTASAGIATGDKDDTHTELIARADIALYEAKRGGGNRVVSVDERQRQRARRRGLRARTRRDPGGWRPGAGTVDARNHRERVAAADRDSRPHPRRGPGGGGPPLARRLRCGPRLPHAPAVPPVRRDQARPQPDRQPARGGVHRGGHLAERRAAHPGDRRGRRDRGAARAAPPDRLPRRSGIRARAPGGARRAAGRRAGPVAVVALAPPRDGARPRLIRPPETSRQRPDTAGDIR